MSSRNRRLGSVALALLLPLGFSTGLAGQSDQPEAPQGQTPPPAQTRPAPGPGSIPDSIQGMVQELRDLQQRLVSIQDRAILQSDELQAQRAAVQRMIEAAMVEVNPEIQEEITRMEELQGEIMAAQEAQDRQRMMELSTEARRIRGQLESAQAEAMDRTAIQEEAESFQESLLDEMVAIQPETDSLIDRLESLTERLREYQRSLETPAPTPPPSDAGPPPSDGAPSPSTPDATPGGAPSDDGPEDPASSGAR